MAQNYSSITQTLNHGFDTLIDVRSPAEFAEDRIPDAINLPVLSNEERAEVGTIYTQQSPFLARKLGAALVFRNAAAHIDGPLRDFTGGWRPLVYCWRGGQRSGSFGWMLGQIGWRADTIEGGYQTWRRLVKSRLYDDPLAHRVILLDGYTGTAKTDLLQLLEQRGVQMLDLEGLAAHRGSLLGGMAQPQPAQKGFETALAVALNALDPDRPVLVEAESSKIGERIIPPSLWKAMKSAPRIEVQADVDQRSHYLTRVYADILSDTERLKGKLTHLRRHRGHEVVEGWFALIDSGDLTGLTRALMQQHYDLSYDRSRSAHGDMIRARVSAPSLTPEGLNATAAKIEAALQTLTG
jgi:tRNA 2-selenouridine synthase